MSRVLVIDDEADVCDALCRVLDREGYDTAFALDAAAGVKMCRDSDIGIVITDVIMPGQNGVDLIRQLRGEFPTIGIIAISGGGNVAIAGYQPDAIKTAAYLAAAEEAGANRCLAKPFERAELLQCLAELTAIGPA